jgi:hypothetical protein
MTSAEKAGALGLEVEESAAEGLQTLHRKISELSMPAVEKTAKLVLEAAENATEGSQTLHRQISEAGMPAVEKAPKLGLVAVVEKATEGLGMLHRKISGVTGVTRTNDGWRVMVEIVERAAIPDTMDLLGLYEVVLNAEGDLVSYERTSVRRRCDVGEAAQ